MKIPSKAVRFVAVFCTALALAACGGGGGATTPTTPTPPVVLASITVNCPNGTSSTATGTDMAAATAAANTACPAAKVVSVTPAQGTTVSVDSLKEVVAMTDSTLDAASLTAVNVKILLGTTPVSGTVLPVGTKGFKFVFAAQAMYGQSYPFTATVKDILGKTVTVNATFTTSAKVCEAPSVFTTGVNACVYPIGVKVYGTNTLPQGCDHASQQCWKDAVASGLVKFIATPALMTNYITDSGVDQSKRNVVFAYFRNTTLFNGVAGLWNTLPMYADNGGLVGPDIYGGVYGELDWVYGTPGGIITHLKDLNICIEITYYPKTTQVGVNSSTWAGKEVTCPQ